MEKTNMSTIHLQCMLIQYIKENYMNFGIKTNEEILNDFYASI